MVGILGVLAAGAAQGYGEASNREVDTHNAVAIEQMRETLRNEYENQRFNRQLEVGMQQAKINAEYENAKYQRNREDKIADRKSNQKFEIEQSERKFQNQRSIEGMRESGRNNRALLRREDSATSQGSNKQLNDLQKTIEADERRLFDLKQSLNDPSKSMGGNKDVIQSEINRIQNRLGQNLMQLQQFQGSDQQSQQNNQKLNLQNILGLQ